VIRLLAQMLRQHTVRGGDHQRVREANHE
jgi:hypothetical protein